MSRSGYRDDYDADHELALYRGQVESAIRGKRGQRFFVDLVRALDRLPEKRLIRDKLRDEEGDVCTLGALVLFRGLDPGSPDDEIDPLDMGDELDIAYQLAAETMWLNDEWYDDQTTEKRYELMHKWAVSKILPETLLALAAAAAPTEAPAP